MPVKKRRHRKSSHADRQEERKNKLLESHPLSVQVTMTVKDGPVLKLRFCYYTQLKIVGVHPDVTIPNRINGKFVHHLYCKKINQYFNYWRKPN